RHPAVRRARRAGLAAGRAAAVAVATAVAVVDPVPDRRQPAGSAAGIVAGPVLPAGAYYAGLSRQLKRHPQAGCPVATPRRLHCATPSIRSHRVALKATVIKAEL